MRYTNYWDFYNQPTTLPIQGLRGRKIDMQMVGNFFVTLLFCMIFVNVLFLGNNEIFGVKKIYVILGLAGLLTFMIYKTDTAKIPFFFYLFSMVTFLIQGLKKKAYVGFQEVPYPEKELTYRWKTKYRDIRDCESSVEFRSYPMRGYVQSNDLKGLEIQTTGATRVTYQPRAHTIKIDVGSFDRRTPFQQVMKPRRLSVIEIGKGKLKFLAKKQNTVGIFTPEIEGKGDVHLEN